MRTDLDTSAADAGAPPTDPDWAEMAANAPAGSKRACWVEYRGYGTDADPIGLSQYEAAADELRERGWQQAKADDATPGQARSLLKKRGWTLVAEFRDTRGAGQLNLMAFEDACVKRYGGGASANPGVGPLG
ncbi:hypothetical protein [Streptomyces purpureus]|uniref:Uncharacterized protein n=1 Tax=Streptomyces purpureus TaxID=1951 RepID=A0A918GZE5_9ACTN|nr:hypothetical protein [Streptomyces purpureus]GGT26809.1 hypothetical protein GCM10014713_20110 [Streptomyces purpureus]